MNTTAYNMGYDTAGESYSTRAHWIFYILPSLTVLLGLAAGVVFSVCVGSAKMLAIPFMLLGLRGLIKILSNLSVLVFVGGGKITITSGILAKKTVDIRLEKAEGIVLYQNLLGKLLHYGTLRIDTGGFYQSVTIADPDKLRAFIISQQRF